MHGLDGAGKLLYVRVQMCLVVFHNRQEILGVQQLVHRSVAIPDLYHVIGDGSGNAAQEGVLAALVFLPDDLQTGIRVEYLNNGLPVNPVNLRRRARTDHRKVIHVQLPQRLMYLQQLRKARHLKDLIDLGRDVQHRQRFPRLLSELHQHAQACRGDVFHPLGVDGHRSFGICVHRFKELRFHRSGVTGIDAALKVNRQHIVLKQLFHICYFPPNRDSTWTALKYIRFMLSGQFHSAHSSLRAHPGMGRIQPCDLSRKPFLCIPHLHFNLPGNIRPSLHFLSGGMQNTVPLHNPSASNVKREYVDTKLNHDYNNLDLVNEVMVCLSDVRAN